MWTQPSLVILDKLITDYGIPITDTMPDSINAIPEGPAQKLIQHFNMQKIPDEGPWFTVTYRSQDVLDTNGLPARYQGRRVAATAIYAVQTKEDFSAMHKLATDEIWHFYGGDPLEMLLLYPDGRGEIVTVGPDVFKGQHPQLVIPRDVWQGSIPIGAGPESYSFFGNTLAPGFEFDDFEMGYRDDLQNRYPRFARHIARLTREEFRSR
jgi:predicted cupin superfamily sugar epimerase